MLLLLLRLLLLLLLLLRRLLLLLLLLPVQDPELKLLPHITGPAEMLITTYRLVLLKAHGSSIASRLEGVHMPVLFHA
jgi:hypothetical protein